MSQLQNISYQEPTLTIEPFQDRYGSIKKFARLSMTHWPAVTGSSCWFFATTQARGFN